MREILFRGKRCDNLDWVEGYLLKECNYETCSWNLGIEYKTDCFGRFAYEVAEIVPYTIGQFTGLTDKNGKKIFEGDIIKFHKFRYEPDWVGTVSYDYCSYIATGRMPLAYEKRIDEDPFYCPFEVALSSIDNGAIEIIGNIYDNPELLEV